MVKKSKKLKVKKNKEVKLNKTFTYALAVIGIFIAVMGLKGMTGVTGAVIGASRTDVSIIGFASFFVGAFLAIFAVSQLAKRK